MVRETWRSNGIGQSHNTDHIGIAFIKEAPRQSCALLLYRGLCVLGGIVTVIEQVPGPTEEDVLTFGFGTPTQFTEVHGQRVQEMGSLGRVGRIDIARRQVHAGDNHVFESDLDITGDILS